MKQIENKAKQIYAQILEAANESQRAALLTDLAGGEDELTAIAEFMDKALDQTDSKAVALLWYFCQQYRVFVGEMPVYADFMPKLYESPKAINE